MQSEKIKKQQQEYIKYRDGNPFISPLDPYQKTEIQLVMEEIGDNYSSIIDFCCGTGRISTLLASDKRKILAIDQSHNSLMKITNTNITPITCIAQSVPIINRWADCILFIQAFQYIPLEEHDAILTELNRLLKKDGSLIISTFCYDAIILRLRITFGKNSSFSRLST